MANPKGKTSRTRTRQRRANTHLAMPSIISCSNCKKPTQAHHVCTSCGYYKGRNVFESKEKEKK
ncbi:MAG: 50S ribosomal protein L32 [Candidatus Eremiobacteraeota bacterium]|nr:50S ribosomal protein L32 [Candidatus Eremiobacteraeota bacterium]